MCGECEYSLGCKIAEAILHTHMQEAGSVVSSCLCVSVTNLGKASDRSSEVFADFILSTKNQYDYSSCNAWCKSRQFFSQLVTSFRLFIVSAQFQFACGSMSPFICWWEGVMDCVLCDESLVYSNYSNLHWSTL